MPKIPQSTFDFLLDLKDNNHREWFAEHKPRYEAALVNMVEIADELLAHMKGHDLIETLSGKKSLHRIYRDVRFSKNKAPYKVHWGGSFKRATARLRGGYYYHIEPGASFIGGGFWGPNKDDLARIRQEIAADASELREILAGEGLQKAFGPMEGSTLKTAPRGYEKDHPAVDLLRHKGFVFRTSFTDKQVKSAEFPALASATFQELRPFFDYMSDVLTTDANGVSLV